jgi:hypothetical protein
MVFGMQRHAAQHCTRQKHDGGELVFHDISMDQVVGIPIFHGRSGTSSRQANFKQSPWQRFCFHFQPVWKITSLQVFAIGL